MKKILSIAVVALLFASCAKEELSFTSSTYEKKSTLPCKENCTAATLVVPVAENAGIVSDSINQTIFNTLRNIVYFGETPSNAKNYNELVDSFIGSYDDMKKKFPDETFGWEAKVKGSVKYESDSIVNIELEHYTFTGGAHGYSGLRSLIFNRETGKLIPNDQLFKDRNAFKAFAEQKFRALYKIPSGPINATGLMFEDEKFHLPQNIFYTDKGLLLYYNLYEVASYADGAKEVLLSYDEVQPYLKTK